MDWIYLGLLVLFAALTVWLVALFGSAEGKR